MSLPDSDLTYWKKTQKPKTNNTTVWNSPRIKALLSSFGIRQEQPGFLLCASQLTPSFSHSPQCQWLAFCVWGEWLSLGFLKQCLRQFRLVVLFLHVHFTWLVILSITGSRVWNIQLLIFNSSLLSSIQSVFAFMICMLLIIITSCCIKLMNM